MYVTTRAIRQMCRDCVVNQSWVGLVVLEGVILIWCPQFDFRWPPRFSPCPLRPPGNILSVGLGRPNREPASSLGASRASIQIPGL
ncbi:predicted protein [Arabidopsis lyrata subsp. lyrata]|uniref:Predicted protein n=1 Tax=Arabidopsis lyrata subsp. lyrata TaxID=81972 RepID=D7LNY4_ARALL|nr:predicted protein [Arabidopsis lyrata subsp. lyrata]